MGDGGWHDELVARMYASAACLDGEFFVTGGETDGIYLDTVERLVPADARRRYATSMAAKQSRYA